MKYTNKYLIMLRLPERPYVKIADRKPTGVGASSAESREAAYRRALKGAVMYGFAEADILYVQFDYNDN